ncbi:DUF4241 domain-containing protein [Catenulispora pinisilvae]|uniref:DUF4241 domain-containing protein n=1 Tax=Catenulispora pinisilvae TaxID=2705253 RepID=UPI001891E4BF|nr:DUF4241 domain-containing protein [Catenulispora pinisilvae]
MEATRVEVAYCEGWDAAAHAMFRPLKEETARERHSAGRRYAVLLSIDAEPRALVQVDTGAGYVGVFSFDLAGRRSLKFSYRDLGDHLMLRELKAWRHVEDEEPEFGADLRITFRFWPDEPVRATLDDTRRGQFTSYVKLPGPLHRIPLLEFGRWPVDGWLLGAFEPLEFGTAPDPETEATGAFWAPWSAPEGAKPTALEALFVAGARIRNGQGEVFEVREPGAVGRLRLTTGRVVAADPATVDLQGEQAAAPYTVTLAPGEYAMETARIRGAGRQVDVVAAARVVVSGAATQTWELALRPGQDERLLGASEFFGFVVDSGTAAFMDASAVVALAAYQDADDAEAAEATIPRDGIAELLTFPSGKGDGSYPVWIGRDAAGAVTCLVADMRLLGRGVEVEAPGSTDGAPSSTENAIERARQVPGEAVLETRDVTGVETFSSQGILEFFNDTADAQAEFWARRMGR